MGNCGMQKACLSPSAFGQRETPTHHQAPRFTMRARQSPRHSSSESLWSACKEARRGLKYPGSLPLLREMTDWYINP